MTVYAPRNISFIVCLSTARVVTIRFHTAVQSMYPYENDECNKNEEGNYEVDCVPSENHRIFISIE